MLPHLHALHHRQLLPPLAFQVTQDDIDRNIWPVALDEFRNIIEDCGDTRGAEIIRSLFDGKYKKISEEELKTAADLAKYFFLPSHTLFAQKLSLNVFPVMNQPARAILFLSLLKLMQNHYQELADKIGDDAEAKKAVSTLSWIPAWTKHKSEVVFKAMDLALSQYNLKNKLLTAFFMLLASYIFILFYAEKPSNKKWLAACAITIAFLMPIIMDKAGDYFFRQSQRQRDLQKQYGDAYGHMLKLIAEIKNRTYAHIPEQINFNDRAILKKITKEKRDITIEAFLNPSAGP